jgi:hypothetical protein
MCNCNDVEFPVKKHDIDRETHPEGMHAVARLDPQPFTVEKSFSAEQAFHPSQKSAGKDQIVG